ncbi:NAD-dependent epimerase/dehydratase family protein [Flavisolibacter ginsenosidimutans]|uniref:NAD(P)-dependent oxidoreductase n=1 Tax=Flavisolibacter ginsenosidimutans TaxID=661481 RepID=A0A5B8UJZ3_9BACT|nr:NAD(P)-dependent oxidoreductase [Flavisolibacter ginsenosidimutans]QEC56479.1 NAD(P)-dependent oxidoreductase [Flavisolibacter ginsenosidimutans]
MKKVLVTGATGFIGRHVIASLQKRDCVVIATASSAESKKGKDWLEHRTFIPHSIGSETKDENLFEKFQKPDAVIHLAWQGLPNYKDLFHFEEVLPRQYFFLKKLVQNGVKDITVTGTCFEYGMQEGGLSEKAYPLPDNPYALAKNTLRLFLEQLQKKTPFSLKWVRLFYMYGEGQNPRSLLAQLDAALQRGDDTFNMSGGEQVRDYLPVEKVAENIVAIALQEKAEGILNCCSGNGITVNELVKQHLEKDGRSIKLNRGFYPYPDYEPMAFWGDATKLKTILAQ